MVSSRFAVVVGLSALPVLAGAQTLVSFYDATITQGVGFWGDQLTAVRFEAQASGTLGSATFALSPAATTQSITLELRALNTDPEGHALDGMTLGSVTLGPGQFQSTGFGNNPALYTVFDFSGQNVTVLGGVSYAWVLSAVDSALESDIYGNTYAMASALDTFTTSDAGMRVHVFTPGEGWSSFAPAFGVIHSASIIPEPSAAAWLAGVGALACVATRRRRGQGLAGE